MLSQQQAQALLQRYHAIEASVSRKHAQLVAVSKSQPYEAMAVLAEAGQQHFAENYWQEAQAKMQALKDYPIVWHFIGRIQHNKAEAIAQHFDWVHSVDRVALAQTLAAVRPTDAEPLQVCLQVNISQEPQKGGVMPDAVRTLADEVASHSQLCLRGLMAIPHAGGDQTQAFADMQQLWQELKQKHESVDTLSLGMSADYLQALEAGATMVRIGQAIFGERKRG